MKYTGLLALIFIFGCSSHPVRNDIYFSYSAFAGLEKYDSRTRIYERSFCGSKKEVKFKVPAGIVNVELIVNEARRIDLEKGHAKGRPDEVCVASACFPPVLEYGIGSSVVTYEQDCCYEDNEWGALFRTIEDELNKYGRIAGLHDTAECHFY
jgi:hypothetical protein